MKEKVSDKIDTYSYCAQQIRSIDEIRYQGKTMSQALSLGNISYPMLVNPIIASYYLPLLITNGAIQSWVYKAMLILKYMYSGYSTITPSIISRKEDEVHEGKRKILFLNFSNKHYSQIFEPITHLKDYQDKFTTYLVGTGDHDGEIQHVNIFRYYSREKTKEIVASVPQHYQIKEFQKIALDDSTIDAKAYNIRKGYFYLMKISLLFQLPILAKYVQMGTALLEDKYPSMVIGGDFCDPRCIALFLLAKSRKIPTMVIQQGLVTGACSDFCFPVTDKVAIWDHTALDRIINIQGGPSEIFEITGNPGYDKYGYDIIPESKEQKIILFISQPHHRHGIHRRKMNRMKRVILQSIKDMKGYRLVVKPHPDEKREWYERQIARIGLKEVVVLNPHDNTREWISRSHALIGFYSTALMEGIALGRPVLVFDDEGQYNFFAPYEREGAAYGVNNIEAIRNVLASYDKDEQMRVSLREGMTKYVERHLGRLDGRASQRVYDLMVSLIQGRNQILTAHIYKKRCI